MFRKILPYAKKYRKETVWTSLLVLGEVLLEIFIPLLMADMVDKAIPSGELAYVIKLGGLMILMALISLTCGAAAARVASVAGAGFGSDVRAALFNKIQQFSFANVDRYSKPSLITRLTTDINYIQMTFMMVIRILARGPMMLVSAGIMAYVMNPRLTPIFVVGILVFSVGMVVLFQICYPRLMVMLKKYDGLNAAIQENLIAIRVVKAFVRADFEKQKFRKANDENMEMSVRCERIMNLQMPLILLIMYGSITAVIWFGGQMVIEGSFLTGQMVSFVGYVTQILMSMIMIAQVLVSTIMTRASITRIGEVLDEQVEILDPPEPAEGYPAVADGSIEFDHVFFSYHQESEQPNLSEINLRIKPGQTVGIIGGTGSAKTSLVQLIPRLYDVTGGSVRVGGRDVREYRVHDLREAVSMVLQKNVLFSGTIRENLLWGDAEATQEEIEAACRAAQAHDFISAFPDGYNTDLGQGGVNVSGGQKQRLCIARALLKKPKILILDDSTSAVDTATDAKIRQAFRENLKDTTKIIIAQRVSSVSDADQIIVMDDGRIDAVGTHEELLATNEIYREVYHSQQKGVA